MSPQGSDAAGRKPAGGVADLGSLLAALGPPDQPPSPREVAELVWLADHLPSRPVRAAPSSAPATADTAAGEAQDRPAAQVTGPAVGPTRLYVSSETAAPAADGPTGDRLSPIRLAGAAALPGTRGLARALRPFKRRTPQRFASVLDEDLTADWIARSEQWMPVLRPADGRWLSAVLVLDEYSGSAAFWDPIARELHRFLQLSGAFVEVRLRRLRPGRGELPALVADPGSPPLDPGTWSGDRAGRRITLVLTDLVAPQWRSPELGRLLRVWAAAGPAAVVQMLPEHLWQRTAFPPASGRFRVAGGARPTTETRWTPYGLSGRRRARGADRDRIAVPVLELTPEWLSPWANAVASGGDFDGAALLVPGPGAPPARFPPAERHADPLAVFRATASPEVFRLAAYLAAVPLTPPIMRMVQTTMMPGSPPSALAEIVFSGLLERVPGATDDPRGGGYEFTAGVRKQLRGTIRRDEVEDVQAALSAFRPDHLPSGARFTAAVTDPAGPDLRPPGAEHWAETPRPLRMRQGRGAESPATANETPENARGDRGGLPGEPSPDRFARPAADPSAQRDGAAAESVRAVGVSRGGPAGTPPGAAAAGGTSRNPAEEAAGLADPAQRHTGAAGDDGPAEDAAAVLARRGIAHLRADRYEEAVADLTAALTLEPGDSEVLARRGEAHLLADRYDEAVTDLTASLTLDPASAEALAHRGVAHRLAGRYEEAVADLTASLALEPTSALALAQRGETHRLTRRYEEALTDFTAILALTPGDAEVLAHRGQVFRLAGRYDEAVADLTASLTLDPASAWALAQRGEAHRLAGRFEEALADFTAALELRPGYAWALAHRGQTYRLPERYEEALTDFTAALELEPGDAWALGQRGVTYRLAERYEEAVADLTTALELEPGDAWTLAQRGIAHRLAGRYEEAVADLTAAIGLEPGYAWVLSDRGLAYRFMGRYEEAVADFTASLALRPSDAWTLGQRGITHRLAGRYEEAVADLTAAIALGPDFAWVLGERGVAHRLLGRYDEAVADFTAALGLKPDYAWALVQRGETHRLAERYDEAVADLTAALELDPTDGWALGSRGQAHRLAGRYEEALADLTASLGLEPRYAWALDDRGLVHRLMGRYDESVADFTASLGLRSDWAWTLVQRGITHRLAGRYEEAVADFTASLGLDSDDEWALAQRGEAYRLMGRYDESVADLTAAAELDPSDPWALADRGLTYRQMKRYEDALTDFRRSIELAPEDDWLHHETALALTLSGKTGAEEEWQRAVRILLAETAQDGPGAAHARGNYMVVLCAMREWTAAAEQLEIFLASSPGRQRTTEALTDLAELAATISLDPERLEPLRRRLRQALDAA
ncbi:SAV_2336 N-terminal domain-related protein [Streptomyces polygonati]|uniref:SAV_2336 N-terminal domain-related protein n=1 Tax=Streptomyces polygonati TaxID=1617087 RepID=A0ABV8HU43_9ACTN